MNHLLIKLQNFNNIILKRSNSKVLSLVILTFSLCFYFILLKIAPPIWDTNDDIAQSMTVHGYGTAAYGIPNLPFSNIIWGYCILLLDNVVNSSIKGYSLATIGILLFCTFGFSFIICVKTKDILTALFCSVIIFAQPMVRPQFTLLAGFTTVMGLFFLLGYKSFKDKTRFVIGIFLVFIGFIVRKEEMFLIVGISLPLIPLREWLSDRFVVIFFGILIFSIGLAGWWDNKMMYERSAYKNNYPLIRIIDYENTTNYKISENILNQNRLSENDYALLRSWFFVDNTLTDPQKLTNLVYDAKNPINLGDFSKQMLKGLSVLISGNILILFVASLLISFFFPSREMLYVWGLTLMSLLLFSYLGRPFPYRVIYPVLAFCMCAPFVIQPAENKFSFFRLRFLVPLLALLTVIHLFYVLKEGNLREWKALRVQQMMLDFPEIPTAIWPQDFPFEMLLPLFQKDNKINKLKLYTLGGILSYYPNSYTQISQKGGSGVLDLFNTEKGVTIFGNPYRFELLKKYCTERFGLYCDSLVRVVDQCEIRVCSCVK